MPDWNKEQPECGNQWLPITIKFTCVIPGQLCLVTLGDEFNGEKNVFLVLLAKFCENKNKQESPSAWTQVAHCPPRNKYSLCCSPGRIPPSNLMADDGGYPPPRWRLDGVPPPEDWMRYPPHVKTRWGTSRVARQTDRRVSNYYLPSYFGNKWWRITKGMLNKTVLLFPIGQKIATDWEKYECVGRESNPDRLLGRQPC